MNNNEQNLTKRPKVSDFHQQNLAAWNPSILVDTIYPFFGAVGLFFLLIGVILIVSTKSINQYEKDYTECPEYNNVNKNYSNRLCMDVLNRNMTSRYSTCSCRIDFELQLDFKGQVYFYYWLQNFYQNHRRYFGSRDDKQLRGLMVQKASCDVLGHEMNGSEVLNYAPCGLIANSLFNDTFELFYINNSRPIPVEMSNKGIAWASDFDLFGTPDSWQNTLKPVSWKESAFERNNKSYKGDEELIVWMRTSSLSTFKKLNRIVLHDKEPFIGGLPAGKYQLNINYAYPVNSFGGRKLFVLGTTNAMGGKNINMGIMCVVLGSLHELIAIVFLFITLFRKKREKSHSTEMIKRPMKHSFSDTPLIMLPLSPDGYSIKEPDEVKPRLVANK